MGGLRDATVLRALVATWLVDVSHADLEPSRLALLDVRDVLHEVAGRATDRVAPETWSELAAGLGLPDDGSAQRQVREVGRRITHLSRLTWQRVEAVLARPPATRRRVPELERVAPGIAVSRGEVVLDRGTDPAGDPLLLLRAAAEAAERRLVLSPATASRLGREGADLPEPWSREARNLFTRLLAAGPGLLPVWETLDETGALARLLPEWERVRLLPHASVVHRFTVDRHLVETCIEASRLIRRVSRPDVLMVAALLHDLGKGQLVDHSVAGEPLAADTAARMGFDEREVALVRGLVRWHLLLAEVSTTRDLEDPATVAYVVERVPDAETLDLLEVLTEADARATSPKAWTAWRAGLVADLARRVRGTLAEGVDRRRPRTRRRTSRSPTPSARTPSRFDVRLDTGEDGATVTVVSGDRTGLIADIAGALTVQRASIRSARAWTQDDLAISVWDVDDTHLDEGDPPAACRGRRDRPDRSRGPAAAAAGHRAGPLGAGPARRLAPGHRDGGPGRGPARRGLPRVLRPRPARRERALSAPDHARPAGGGRVLRAGAGRRCAERRTRRVGGARGPTGAAGPGYP